MLKRTEQGDNALVDYFSAVLRERIALGRERGDAHWMHLDPTDLLHVLALELVDLTASMARGERGAAQNRCADLAAAAAMIGARVGGFAFDDKDVVPSFEDEL